ncbi:zinc-regulated transporter 1 [Rhypophila decipiens]|uniref:Zinc-regulated transporter 1 n=1 Tax=Rhypophila decipiens TaxID=261697 RepID=A0AAN6XWW9_9PEZI|nr:zinc-regulated transporter 1 [Rhypophila decipiens]
MADSSTTALDVFDPSNVNLSNVSDELYKQIICFLKARSSPPESNIGLRISALFVILVTASLTTLFPVVTTRVHLFHVPLYVYIFARYFGAGIIIATAFIHLLDPAYEAIGPYTCVGLTKGWKGYSWPPSIAMASAMLIFLLDFGAEWYVERTFGLEHQHKAVEETTPVPDNRSAPSGHPLRSRQLSIVSHHSHQFLHSADQDDELSHPEPEDAESTAGEEKAAVAERDVEIVPSPTTSIAARETERGFRSQIAAFMILEFGVIVHSVIIGLNLGASGDEFTSLYPVVVFHQAFEGLGIGARLSVIPFPPRFTWLPWSFCALYGLSTPLSLAAGLFIAKAYDPASFTASIVSGVLDSISAGILLYTGLVELLARDFLFNPDRTRKTKRICFMLGSLFLGLFLMALLGKWA